MKMAGLVVFVIPADLERKVLRMQEFPIQPTTNNDFE
jgi:hypothetical protein